MAIATQNLTDQDVKFLQFQKSKGVDAQTAMQKLDAIKQSGKVQMESKVPPSSAALYMQRKAGVPEDQAYQRASTEKAIAQPEGTMGSRFKEGVKERFQAGVQRSKEGIEMAKTAGDKTTSPWGKSYEEFKGGYQFGAGIGEATIGALIQGGADAVIPPIANSIKEAYTTPAVAGRETSAQDIVGKVSKYTPDFVKDAVKGEVGNMASTLGTIYNVLPEKAQDEFEFFAWNGILGADLALIGEVPALIKAVQKFSPKLAGALDKFLQESAEKAPQKFDEIYGATTKALGDAGESIRGTTTKVGEVAGTAKEYGISQATGLSPETFGTIRKTPDLFEQAQKGLITRETLADDVAKAMDEIIEAKGTAGREYGTVRKSTDTFTIPKKSFDDLLAKRGLVIEGDAIKPSGRLSTSLTDTDISKVNRAWKKVTEGVEVADNITLNADQALNIRQPLDVLSKWEQGMTDKGTTLVRDMRGIVDNFAKKEIKGLAELDAQFSDVAKQFKKLKNDFFKYEDGNVVLKDNAMTKIANLTNKGREQVLKRLEEVAPDIADKIRVVKAIDDIENAMGQKVGAYTRSVLGGGGAVMTYLNPAVGIPMLLGSMLTNPKVAAGIMKKYAQKFRLSPKRIEGIIDTVTNMGKLTKGDAKAIVETAKLLPAGKGETLAGEAFANRLRYGAKNQAKQLPVGRTADAAFDQTIKKGGVTIRSTGGAPNKGYVVSPYKEFEAIVDAQDMSVAKIEEYMVDHADILAEEGHHLGLWYNADDGKIYIDTVVVKGSADDAYKLAKDNKQIAFYDLEQGTEITTKGYSPSKSKSLKGGTGASGGSAKSTGKVDGEYLYHGTNKTTLENIQKEGIVPQRRGVSSFSKSEAYSRNWSDNPYTKTEGVMFRVKKDAVKGLTKPTSKVKTDQLYEVLTKETVPPEAIEVLKDGKWTSLKGGGGQARITDAKQFERAKGLSKQDRLVENRAFKKVLAEEDDILDDYIKENGKYVSADKMRPYFEEVGYTGSNAAAVQEPSSYLGKRAYTRSLENTGEFVTATGGGSGAGKSTALDSLPKFAEATDMSSTIYDSNLSSYKSMLKKVAEAEAKGKSFIEFFTYRDPIDAFENGVVKRMIQNPKEAGRLVPAEITAKNTIGSWDVAKKYHDNGGKVFFVDNSLGKGKAKIVSREVLEKKVKYPSVEELTKKFKEIARRLYKEGKIDADQLKGYLG